MFGKFSIAINGNSLSNFTGHTKRVWMLIQYLITNRNSPAPLEQLLKDIWDGKNCGDPENALKNLIYRARVILRNLAEDERAQFIIFINGTYSWNNQYDCIVDTEQFLKYYTEAEQKGRPAEERAKDYHNAINRYQGIFLPKSAYSRWVLNWDTMFSELFNDSVRKLCNLLKEQENYAEIEQVCKTALKYFPFEKRHHRTLLEAYVNCGKRNLAFEHYNQSTKLFYQEFGVDVSTYLKPYYKKLMNKGSHMEFDLDVIKRDLKEEAMIKGAYFCDYDIFKGIYRTQARMISRTGQSVFLALFTICGTDGFAPKPETAKTAFERLKRVIIENLRKGDAVSSYSSTQFIVLLPVISFENAQNVIERILRKFRFEYRKNDIGVTTKLSPIL